MRSLRQLPPLFVAVVACAPPVAPPAGRNHDEEATRVFAVVVGVEQQRIPPQEPGVHDHFGGSVALSGSDAVIGAEWGSLQAGGGAYVFARTGISWTRQARLVPTDATTNDYFGTAVAISGDTILVGGRGSAYVFTRSGSSWTEQQKLVPPDNVERPEYGTAVALEGDLALVGSLSDENYRGAVFPFIRSGSAWIAQARITAPDAIRVDSFGATISLSGSTALIGAPGHAAGRGAAYVYVRSGSSFALQQLLTASDSADNDSFGTSVAVSGDRALIGASFKNNFLGAAYLFGRSGSTWIEQNQLTGFGERFGNRVALSGDLGLVGTEDPYRAFAFVWSGTAPPLRFELRSSTADGFGTLALLGDTALLGAPYDGAGESSPGAAYVFLLRKEAGDPCSAPAECVSGQCVDGRCCDTACNGACDACSAAAGATRDGECALLPAGSEGAPACGTLACTGASPQCTACATDAHCPEARYCAADGSCQPRKPLGDRCDLGAGRDCKVDGCRTCGAAACDPQSAPVCSADGLCACGGFGARCKDDGHTAVAAVSNVETDCSPYRCLEGMGCRSRCTLSTQCLEGFVCHPSRGECVQTGSVAPAPAGGCGCRIPTSPYRPTWETALLLLLLRSAWRRQSPRRPGPR